MRATAIRLSSVAAIARDSVDPKAILKASAYVGLEHVGEDGALTNALIVSPGDLLSTKFRFTSRHVLFGKLRPYLRKIARPSFDGICSTDIIPILPSCQLDRDYLFHFLRTDAVIERATLLSVGINLPRLSPSHLLEFEIPLPPLDEQRRIAAILDQADDLRRKRRLALEKLNALPQAIFHEMFGELLLRGTFSRLDGLIDNHDRINYGVVQPGSEAVDGVPLIRVANLVANDFSLKSLKLISTTIESQYKRSRLRGSEVLVACVGSIGAVAMATPDFAGMNIARAVARVPIDSIKANRTYVAWFLRLPQTQNYFISETRTVAQPTLNIKQLGETRILDAPRELQESFAMRVAAISTLKEHYLRSLHRLDRLFASLQHHAFAGTLTASADATRLASLQRQHLAPV